MAAVRELSVSIIGDSPFCVLGLEVMLGSMGVNIRAVHDRLEALSECDMGGDAIIIDIYFADEMQAFRSAKKMKNETEGRFVIFSDIEWADSDGMTFIRRNAQCETIKTHLLQGIVGGKGEEALLEQQSDTDPGNNISNSEAFVLKEWLRGRTVTDIARLSNRSIKTISSHKRNAMKKLMVRNNTELYWELVKKG
ncbi:LuxR C-terminal-related transcriptional regulator [Serratia liquefaciens]|uniref:LuxR C-terminal-related transcriptional regulator n=1 Tax=Serratia liquefaciens TaxID=614 RepID=UPI003905CA5F